MAPRVIAGELSGGGDIVLTANDADYLWTFASFGTSPDRDIRLERLFGVLSLMEAHHILANPGKYSSTLSLEIHHEATRLNCTQLAKLIQERHGVEGYLRSIVYDELRSRGWVVQSGINYGVDFLLYRRRPEVEHSPFAVLVRTEGDRITWQDAMAFNRVTATAKKQLIIAFVDGQQRACRYLKVARWVPELTKSGVMDCPKDRESPIKFDEEW